MMVEHHLGQQQQGEEPEGAAESTGTQETYTPGITDTEAESRLDTSGKAPSMFRLGGVGGGPAQEEARRTHCGVASSVARNYIHNMDIYAYITCICILHFFY